MAGVAIPAMLGTALEYAPMAISAGSSAMKFGQKYGPSVVRGVKSLANNIFSAGKRKSAVQYVKGLSKPKGWAKLAQDSAKAVKSASGLITSGKLMKGVNEVAGDMKGVLDASKGLLGNERHGALVNKVNQSQSQLQNWHDVAHSYNETGKQLANQFQNQIMKRN